MITPPNIATRVIFVEKFYLVMMLKPEFFYQIPLSIFVLQSFDTKKYTIKISLTKTVFSFASSVDALQNTCILSKQKVSN